MLAQTTLLRQLYYCPLFEGIEVLRSKTAELVPLAQLDGSVSLPKLPAEPLLSKQDAGPSAQAQGLGMTA
jgi:hypothetical protein